MEYHEFTISDEQACYTARAAAKEILEFMATPSILEKISDTHKVNAKSHEIQKIFLDKCIEMGFSSEKKGLFSTSVTTRLRPDYYLPIGDTGLIMEVERGKTTTNNMDLLDLWKCHICEHADYLLLVVPIIRQNSNGGKINIFSHVVNRLSSFFEPKNQVNVKGCFIIGY